MNKERLIDAFGKDFAFRHGPVWMLAYKHSLALCGGASTALAYNMKEYQPKDLDFAVEKHEELAYFIGDLTDYLTKKPTHFRIFANSLNKFVPEGAVAHLRISSAYWVPLCVFVVPGLKYYRIKGGLMVQDRSQVRAAAVALSQRDGKKRIAAEEEPKKDIWADLLAEKAEAMLSGKYVPGQLPHYSPKP